jgi:hypothetical protein
MFLAGPDTFVRTPIVPRRPSCTAVGRPSRVRSGYGSRISREIDGSGERGVEAFRTSVRSGATFGPKRFGRRSEADRRSVRSVSGVGPMRIDVRSEAFRASVRCGSMFGPKRFGRRSEAGRRSVRSVSGVGPMRIDVRSEALRTAAPSMPGWRPTLRLLVPSPPPAPLEIAFQDCEQKTAPLPKGPSPRP